MCHNSSRFINLKFYVEVKIVDKSYFVLQTVVLSVLFVAIYAQNPDSEAETLNFESVSQLL